jgi:hypothetical protein
MSFPFGNHPTLGTYIEWLREKHGGSTLTGTGKDSSGRRHATTKLSLPNGNTVVVSGIARTEHVAPRIISHIDRRLGVKSPWNIDS